MHTLATTGGSPRPCNAAPVTTPRNVMSTTGLEATCRATVTATDDGFDGGAVGRVGGDNDGGGSLRGGKSTSGASRQ